MYLTELMAYIDPMSGAVVLQLIVAFFLGIAAFFRRSLWAALGLLCFWKRPKSDKELNE